MLIKTHFLKEAILMCVIPIYAQGQASNTISISTLQQESDVATALTRGDVKHLMQSAQTRDQFERLAAYFDRQAEEYTAKCESEQKELDRLFALHYHARSYPAQVENTRSRIDHFKALSLKNTEQAQLNWSRAKGDGTTGTSSGPSPNSYSHSELKRLIRNAHTPAEFNALAEYFDGKRQQFARKVLEEKSELDRLLARPYTLSKYPSPVDTAKGLIQYYDMKAEECGRRAGSFWLQAKSGDKTAAVSAKP